MMTALRTDGSKTKNEEMQKLSTSQKIIIDLDIRHPKLVIANIIIVIIGFICMWIGIGLVIMLSEISPEWQKLIATILIQGGAIVLILAGVVLVVLFIMSWIRMKREHGK